MSPTDWPAIIREHGPAAFEAAWRILGNAADTEDAVQDALVDALRIRRRGTVVRNWPALLRHMATCRALDVLRRRRAARLAAPPFAAETVAPGWSQPDAAAVATEQMLLLRQALVRLPQRQAMVFSLRYLGDLTNAEIAEMLDIAPGAVAVALHRARGRLRELLQHHED